MAEAAAPAGGRVVAPDGTVSYDFDGHVSAKGVDLPAINFPVSTPEAVPTASGITWVPLAGGVAARVWADTRGLDLYADGTIMARAGDAARVVLQDDGTSDFALANDVLRKADVVVASFTVGAGTVDNAGITHNLGAVPEVIGSVRDWGDASAVTWSIAVIDNDNLEVWVKNNAPATATFDIRLFLITT